MSERARLELGKAVRFHRIRAGVTQLELAKVLGKADASYVSHIERGKQNLTLDTMCLLANALGFDLHVSFRPRSE